MSQNDQSLLLTTEIYKLPWMTFPSDLGLKLEDLQPRQKLALAALQDLAIFDKLSRYSPVLAGTIPLDIDIETSDLDIICQCKNLQEFEATVKFSFENLPGFQCFNCAVRGEPSFVARFQSHDFEIEIFCQDIPVQDQFALLHLNVEARLLRLSNPSAKENIRKLKQSGLKTEPAFAQYFKIAGDPYEELAKMAKWTDKQLKAFVAGLTS